MMKIRPRMTSIKKRLILCFLLLEAVMGIICLVVFASNVMVSSRYNIYDSSAIILDISNNVSELKAATERYLSTKTTDSLEKAHECMNSLGLLTYDLKTLSPTSQINMMMIDIADMTDNLMDDVNTALLAKINRNAGKYTSEFENVSRLSSYIGEHCIRLNELLTDKNGVELKAQMRRQNMLDLMIIVGFGVISAACVVFIIYQSGEISRPIIELAQSAHEISTGNAETPDITSASNRETRLMAESFNKMKEDIRDNIKRLEKQRVLEVALKEEQMDNLRIQTLLRDAEYVALQSQIQPHFLFNTINAGLQIAYREGADETVEYLDNMSLLFRYSLKNIESPVTLADEMGQVERYLYILEKRFAGSMSFKVTADFSAEEKRSVEMPLMVLQPLVENSYAHGIRGINGGRIEVRALKEDGFYAVKINDNGAGMSGEDVERLLRGEKINESAEKAKSLGIGVSNVKNRLELFYRRDRVMDIKSTLGRGTEVTVYLKEVTE